MEIANLWFLKVCSDKNHVLLAGLYGTANASIANGHRAAATALRAGVIDLLWDPTKVRTAQCDEHPTPI